MSIERHVRLFKNGSNQAVRIPREFEMPGEEVIMRKEGDRLVVTANEREFSRVPGLTVENWLR